MPDALPDATWAQSYKTIALTTEHPATHSPDSYHNQTITSTGLILI